MREINIGIIVNTHGLKGEMKVKVVSDFPALRFAKHAHVFVKYQKQVIELVIRSVRVNKDMLIVLFEDYENINEIEFLKGSTLFIYENQLQKLQDDEAYYFEMMDSVVYDMENHLIGSVIEVIETGANVVLRVQGEHEQKLIPFVKNFVKEFDKENKVMHVEMIEGL